MIITAPVTDYIPASLMIAGGDMVRRGAAIPARLARPGPYSLLLGLTHDAFPQWRSAEAAAQLLFKSKGAGNEPVFEALALRDTGIHIGGGTQNAAGPQVIAGVGFQSSIVLFLFSDDVALNLNWGIGFDDGTVRNCVYSRLNGTESRVATDRSMCIRRGAGDAIFGDITAIGADGFTFNWTLVGAAVVDFSYLCLP